MNAISFFVNIDNFHFSFIIIRQKSIFKVWQFKKMFIQQNIDKFKVLFFHWLGMFYYVHYTGLIYVKQAI